MSALRRGPRVHRKLSTPSLGITESCYRGVPPGAPEDFQLPLSGSPFGTAAEGPSPRGFQLPLSGSLYIRGMNVIYLREALFQLPLSGSQVARRPAGVGRCIGLSTPSLGITRLTTVKSETASISAFNSLSRDHRITNSVQFKKHAVIPLSTPSLGITL